MEREVKTCDVAFYWCQLSWTGLLLNNGVMAVHRSYETVAITELKRPAPLKVAKLISIPIPPENLGQVSFGEPHGNGAHKYP